jgi:hypothetical protein
LLPLALVFLSALMAHTFTRLTDPLKRIV